MRILERISNVWLKVSILPVHNNNHLAVGSRVENVLMVEVHHTRGVNQIRIQQLDFLL